MGEVIERRLEAVAGRALPPDAELCGQPGRAMHDRHDRCLGRAHRPVIQPMAGWPTRGRSEWHGRGPEHPSGPQGGVRPGERDEWDMGWTIVLRVPQWGRWFPSFRG